MHYAVFRQARPSLFAFCAGRFRIARVARYNRLINEVRVMNRTVFAVCAALTASSAVSFGQIPVTSVGGFPFIEAWVDPCNGNDFLASLSNPPCQSAPYRTINAAIAGALAGGASAATPGLVHCDAGIYAASTNGETFPIVMRDWVHLQGVGARQCVIRGEGASPMGVFLPFSNGTCTCGSAPPFPLREVLVDLSALFDASEEMIDGLTFQGGDVQVYFR